MCLLTKPLSILNVKTFVRNVHGMNKGGCNEPGSKVRSISGSIVVFYPLVSGDFMMYATVFMCILQI